MSDGAAVEMRGVTKAFRDVPVLCGVDLSVERGETFTILGGSGSGKSVCLKHMIGLLRPDRGQVLVAGREITGLSESALIDVRTHVSMVFQSAALFDSLTVFGNVAYPLREHRRWSEAQVEERVAECLAAVGLVGSEGLMPAELSGGMRKRVGVARGIALEPATILYDEPTTGLDPANQRRIGELIRSLQQRLRVTSIIVTHELELCFAISDRVALLKDGRIVACGSSGAMQHSEHPDVREFLAGEHATAETAAPAGAREIHGT
ncbi:MAG: ABC transporter ATP-binding protein [Deltaproteobacteria bacterium]|nr:ABC transporter ATP-binding protein [Deltaproteobacteria bacterium]MBW2359917.1 ABC transporter ATP-binding protein [Deltaproteobacteria bacterium]